MSNVEKNKALYAHFHPDEHHFVDKAWEWIEQANEYHRVKRTDFLDPRQAFILTSLAQRALNVKVSLNGGYDAAERKRALVAPDYDASDSDPSNWGIVVLAVTSGDGKFVSLTHGDYMGSILGIGIKRDKVGDIHVLDTGCHCLVAEEVSSYMQSQLVQVHRLSVVSEILPLDQLQQHETLLDQISLSVASLRLDGIVSDAFRLSRAKVLQPIKAGKCRVNWKVEEDPSKFLKINDMVSLQGFGRFKVLAIEGVTKKDRVRIIIGRFK